MSDQLTICLAQLDFKVADIKGNLEKIIRAVEKARDQHQADIIAFPELTLTSYPPEDLLLRKDLYSHIQQALEQLLSYSKDINIIVGYPKLVGDKPYNTAGWLQNGDIIAEHYKHRLPNYGVFDEQRYFQSGQQSTVVNFKGIKIGILLCEDLWGSKPIRQTKEAGADFVIALNASPFTMKKAEQRLTVLTNRIAETNLPVFYVNHVGGQDDLLFDGDSMVLNSDKQICLKAPFFQEGLFSTSINLNDFSIQKQDLPQQSKEEIIYQGLVTGVRDYVTKNGFPGVLIGLSGGIDSALTLAVAVDALGPERVKAVMMPSRYTASMSEEDAEEEARLLGCDYQVIEINSIYQAFEEQLSPLFKDLSIDKTEENLQARIRGTLLMALSNKFGQLVLTTGNKSELAVGYSTLYGDMAGGYCVLKDVYKSLVYQLVLYRNSLSPAIPKRVIDRPPSAELSPDQADEDSLLPYVTLDKIIDAFVEQDLSIEAIIEQGYLAEDVKRVLKLIHSSEFKRRQAPPGPRITSRSFGRNRRYPITSGFWDLISN